DRGGSVNPTRSKVEGRTGDGVTARMPRGLLAPVRGLTARGARRRCAQMDGRRPPSRRGTGSGLQAGSFPHFHAGRVLLVWTCTAFLDFVPCRSQKSYVYLHLTYVIALYTPLCSVPWQHVDT